MRTKCCKCGTELHGRNAQDMGICLDCYNIENSDFEEEEEGMRTPTKLKTTMTEAERIEKDADSAAYKYINDTEYYIGFHDGYTTGATAENERLQLKEKEEITNNFIQINKDAAIIIKDLRTLNETTEAELKSAQELNRELVEALNDLYMHTPNLDWDAKPKTTFDVSLREAIVNAQILIKEHRK